MNLWFVGLIVAGMLVASAGTLAATAAAQPAPTMSPTASPMSTMNP